MLKTWLNRIFVMLIIGFLTLGSIKAILFVKDINYYENRPAEKIAPFSVGTYLDVSFQDQFEKGMMDQVPFSQRYKKAYNSFSSHYLQSIMQPIIKGNPDRYISYMGKQIFGSDYITYYTYILSERIPYLDAKISNYNSYFEKMPDLDFYLYYIEKDTDINFETNEKVGAYEYMQERLILPEDRITKFEINNFDEFSSYFYKTDHHWNYKGSYKAYAEVMKLLESTDSLLTPSAEEKLPYTFSGSKAAGTGADAFSENFAAYKFQYPDMKVKINGTDAADYGNQEAYFMHEPTIISYAEFYGDDSGEIVFDTNQPEKENILIIGESYDNAILKLIASHYNQTYSIDLRNYEVSMGKKFSFTKYVQEHNISKVLLIGNIDYFVLDEFMLED